jgi:hypothetical protein
MEKSKMPKRFNSNTIDKSIPSEMLNTISSIVNPFGANKVIQSKVIQYSDRYNYDTSNLMGIEDKKFIVRESGSRLYENSYTETEAYMSDKNVFVVEWRLRKTPTSCMIYVVYYKDLNSNPIYLAARFVPADHVYYFIIEREPPYLVISVKDVTAGQWIFINEYKNIGLESGGKIEYVMSSIEYDRAGSGSLNFESETTYFLGSDGFLWTNFKNFVLSHWYYNDSPYTSIVHHNNELYYRDTCYVNDS